MACSVSSLDWARIHCANPGRFSDSQYAAIERYWYAENNSFLICSFIASSTALPSKVISSFSSFAKSLPLLYRSPDGEPARIADEPVGVYWVVLMVGTVGKGAPVVMIPDTSNPLPYARGNARLATLEWANEVARPPGARPASPRTNLPSMPPTCATL